MIPCEETSVGTVLVIDCSESMLQRMNDVVPNKFEAARLIATAFVDELLTKDNMAIQNFSVTPAARLGMTNDKAVLTQAINGLSPYETIFVAEGSSNIAAALELAYATVEACAPDDSDLSTGSGSSSGEVASSEHNFHGSGPPPVDLGLPGDTYVDDDTDGFYWKSLSGWKP